MSLICMLAMGLDKLKAKQGARRIPEFRLFLLALLGGGPGGWLGMYAFRHYEIDGSAEQTDATLQFRTWETAPYTDGEWSYGLAAPTGGETTPGEGEDGGTQAAANRIR